ncbi:MAG: hypothetical protein ACK4UY_03780 [Dietzia sp.]
MLDGATLDALGDHAPQLITVAAFLTALKFILQGASEVSEKVARLLGPLGRFWRERGRRRDERGSRDEERTDLIRQRDHLAERLKVVIRNRNTTDDYLEYDARWHARLERCAATEYPDDDLPEHLTYDEFAERREVGDPDPGHLDE